MTKWISEAPERFWDKVMPEPNSGCWFWMGAVRRRYGTLSVSGRMEAAHRVSYSLFIGPIPEGLYVCHSCDEPLCVNPDHLWVGTCRDNAQDRVAKDRGAHAEKHGHTSLTRSSVNAIRFLRRRGLKTPLIAKIYGIKRPNVSQICLGRTWKNV